MPHPILATRGFGSTLVDHAGSSDPSPSKRSGLSSFRLFGGSSSRKQESSNGAKPPADMSNPPTIAEDAGAGLLMPESHPTAAIDMQQEEALEAGESTISKSAAPKRASRHGGGDRASHAGRASVSEPSAPPAAAPDAPDPMAALVKCMPCLQQFKPP